MASQSPQILIAVIGVFAALAGTIIGSIATYFANKNLKRKEWELTLIKDDFNERKNLYSEFLAEGYRLLIMPTDKDNSITMQDLNILNRYFSKIELISLLLYILTMDVRFERLLDTEEPVLLYQARKAVALNSSWVPLPFQSC